MNENKRILFDLIFVLIYYLIIIVCIGYPLSLICYADLMNKPQLWNNNRIMISLCLLFIAIIMCLVVLLKQRNRFNGKK